MIKKDKDTLTETELKELEKIENKRKFIIINNQLWLN